MGDAKLNLRIFVNPSFDDLVMKQVNSLYKTYYGIILSLKSGTFAAINLVS